MRYTHSVLALEETHTVPGYLEVDPMKNQVPFQRPSIEDLMDVSLSRFTHQTVNRFLLLQVTPVPVRLFWSTNCLACEGINQFQAIQTGNDEEREEENIHPEKMDQPFMSQYQVRILLQKMDEFQRTFRYPINDL